ncbi:MAG TPA: hypothetical protein VNO84_02435 [Burkholderiaceae bacterium]|nr:hypothetical protein [Burkholderiaceae bacterium]
MKFIPSKPVVLALSALVALLGFWGYCYELAYFARLKLVVHEHLGLKHFVVSSGATVIPMLVVIVIFENVKRFFSKEIYVDPRSEVSEHLKAENFEKFIVVARVGAGIAVGYLALVLALPAIGVNVAIWPMYLYMVFVVMQTFFGAVLTSPVHSYFPIALAFVISTAACFAGGGYGYANSANSASKDVMRDDLVVKITRSSNGEFNVDPKELKLPLPPSFKFIESLGWEK